MGKTLYLECNSGISGNMTVGALLDLGADRDKFENVIESMKLEGYKLNFGRTKKHGIDAYDFDVKLCDPELELLRAKLEKAGINTDKNSECQCGHNHESHQGHNCSCNHHHHEHECSDEHEHEHRHIKEIYDIIESSTATVRAKELAKQIFKIVAEAESKAHGVPMEKVHFHEVGAIDSIIDIVGTAVCIDDLNIEKVIVSPLAEGRGYVWCDHGIMPVPVPATLNIAVSHGLILKTTENDGEMVTPTGAAIAAALNSGEKLPRKYEVKKIGLGAGSKDFKTANILRAMVIEEISIEEDNAIENNNGCMWKLETNLDDCTGEAMGFTMEKLMEAGAADAWYMPIYMKKNRPAYMLSVLCSEEKIEALEDIIFSNTTTIGIRRYQVERTTLNRKIITKEIDISIGDNELSKAHKKEVKLKLCKYKEKEYLYPEYESVKEIAEEFHLDFKRAEQIVKDAVK